MTSAIVSLNHVSKHYQQVAALSDVCVELKAGEVIGLLGHNGAGKTTLMKLVLGVISPSAGQVQVFNIAPDSKAAWHSRSQIGYLPENVSFYEQLTGLEVLHYFAKLKGFDRNHALTLLEQVGLTHAMQRKVKTYSKGMRQRLGLAQAFLGKPKLLLLDEPTVGLDPIATSEFYQTVDQLKSDGASIILCSHVLPGIERHIDRALILSAGQVLASGTLEQLRQQANLPATIIPSGINGHASLDQTLSPFLMQDKQRLCVPEREKIRVLKHLLSLDSLQNIAMESAGLDQLYQHYLAQTPAKPESDS